MMSEKLYLSADKILHFTFYFLLFTVPLAFTPWNFELFEFNKMMLTYALTVVIVACWAVKCIIAGKLIFRKSLLFLPLLLFLLSQILSTIGSIDIHTSIWGYYTRSNGGLLSTITYILLYYAFVSNFDIRKTPAYVEASVGRQNAIRYLLSSALIVSVWGILEHFGKSPSCLILTGNFDASCWVQDVQNRVFATLGQPNWMAAFLVAVTPLSWALVISKKQKEKSEKLFNRLAYYILPLTFFLSLLYTKSRSGLLGFAISFLVFWGITFLIHNSKFLIRSFVLLFTFYLLLIAIFGSPWSPGMLGQRTKDLGQRAESGTVLERGGTESGEIRKIVWKGAMDIWRAYPLTGSGVETFAYSYYNFRPVEHNLTSEWNFLYNKAHNEYLNFLATTGVFGLGAYLLLIGSFLWWSVSRMRNQESEEKNIIPNSQFIIHNSLLAGFAGILVTNFFGFSVVPVALLFFLYPAMAQVVTRHTEHVTSLVKFNTKHLILTAIVLLVTCYLLLRLSQLWYADTLFNQADKLINKFVSDEIKNDQPATAAQKLEQAINLNSGEPNYHDKLATAYSTLAGTLAEENNLGDAKRYAELAKNATDKAYAISPRNLSILKSRASTFSRLTSVDPSYMAFALATLERAAILAPTDPTINYNLAIAYFRTGQSKEAINTLEKLIKMKADYLDGYLALAQIYLSEGQKKEAKEKLEYILKNIDPNNEIVKSLLEKL